MPGINSTDEDLIRAYQKGDNRAFDRLIEKWHLYMYKFFRIKGLPREDAEDATVFLCIKLERTLKNFKFKASFKTFLFKAMDRMAFDYYKDRAKKKNRFRFLDGLIRGIGEDNEMKFIDKFADKKSESPDAEMLYKELLNVLRNCLSKIENRKHKAILVLWLAGLKIKHIAKILGYTEGTVMGNLHRKRDELRACIRNHYPML